jgi:uncharacterized repeat protein (TIGR01451 family)
MSRTQGFPKVGNKISACLFTGLSTILAQNMVSICAFAQGPPVMMRVPVVAAPLMAFELTLPEGCHALWPARKSPAEIPTLERLESKSRILLRPGYAYTFAVVTTEGNRQCVTLEVHESLRLPPVTKIEDHPAPLAIHPEDLIGTARPRLITKGICLLSNPADNPEVKDAVANSEVILLPGANLGKEAALRGRLIGIIRSGNRSLSDVEIAQTAIPGTALLPGQTSLCPPVIPPYIIPSLQQAGPDPIGGPGDLMEEIVRDGGDRGQRAGIDGQGKIAGIDPEDSLASFTDSKGRRRVIHSNRVCIIAPRFQSLILSDPLDKFEGSNGLAMDVGRLNQGKIAMAQLAGKTGTREQPGDVKGRLSPSANVAKEGIIKVGKITILEGQEGLKLPVATEGRLMPGRVAQEAGLKLTAKGEKTRNLHGAIGLSGTVSSSTVSALFADQPGTDPVSSSFSVRETSVDAMCAEQASSGPMELRKCCDKMSARPGDILTFTLRFTNTSGHPLKDIGLVDALNQRLEYVEGTSQCSRDAIFLQQSGQDGTVELRWEIQGVLQPGDQAVVQFQTKVK